MAEHEYFQHALSDFTFDLANGGAIRPLTDRGYTVWQIMEHLAVLANYEKVQQTVWKHLIERRIILLQEPGTNTQREQERYVKEYGAFGKTSFRRVSVPDETRLQTPLRDISYTRGDKDVLEWIMEKRKKNGRESAYISCDFGRMKQEEPKRYEACLSILDDRQRDYIDGLPWNRQTAYHRLDARMFEITGRLLELGQYSGSCYFLKLGEKLSL